jgi:hypothetical protein
MRNHGINMRNQLDVIRMNLHSENQASTGQCVDLGLSIDELLAFTQLRRSQDPNYPLYGKVNPIHSKELFNMIWKDGMQKLKKTS